MEAPNHFHGREQHAEAEVAPRCSLTVSCYSSHHVRPPASGITLDWLKDTKSIRLTGLPALLGPRRCYTMSCHTCHAISPMRRKAKVGCSNICSFLPWVPFNRERNAYTPDFLLASRVQETLIHVPECASVRDVQPEHKGMNFHSRMCRRSNAS